MNSMPYALFLADAARATGLPVVEVAGWQTAGHGPMRGFFGVCGHHTATSEKASGDYPSLNVVKNGRAGLAGPLANLGLGRSGTVFVIAAGTAWHAGASKFGAFVDLNDEFIGIEAEDSGDGTWTPAMLAAYPKLVGSLLKYMKLGVDRYCSHRTCATPAGRKPDPAGISDAWMRERAQAWMNGTGSGTIVLPPGSGALTHTVIGGETLWSIGRKYGVTVQNLQAWNGLASSVIRSGMVLRVANPANATLVISTAENATAAEVRYFQGFMNRVFPSYMSTPLALDGIYGPACARACQEFQGRVKILADGVLGPSTRVKLSAYGYRP